MDLREQRFGIEIEMTGITREKAAEVTAEYFGTRRIMSEPTMTPMRPSTIRDGSGSL